MSVDRTGLLRAAQAYQARTAPAGLQQPYAESSFTDLLTRAVGGAVESGRRSDAVRAAVASGQKPDFLEVVTAVAESEAALETLVAVRDKVIQAYEDVMRMPI